MPAADLRRRTVDLLAPGTTQHPAVWDWIARRAARSSVDTVYEIPQLPFSELDLSAPGLGAAFEELRRFRSTEALYVSNAPAMLLPNGFVVAHGVLDDRGVIDHERWTAQRPSVRRTVLMRALRRVQSVDVALSFRSIGEANYFHFLNDLVGGVLRISEVGGVPDSVPLVISERMAATSFISELRAMPLFAGREWIVQGTHEIVRAQKLYFAQSPRYALENIEFVRSRLGSQGESSGDRRLLIFRRGGGRQFVNLEEVAAVCRRHGFELVDTGELSVHDQISLFRDARYVVGAHGAGLTNVLFRTGGPCDLLELFPESAFSIGWPMCHYFYVCKALGFGYQALLVEQVGDDASNRGGQMVVDPSALAERIQQMLSGGT